MRELSRGFGNLAIKCTAHVLLIAFLAPRLPLGSSLEASRESAGQVIYYLHTMKARCTLVYLEIQKYATRLQELNRATPNPPHLPVTMQGHVKLESDSMHPEAHLGDSDRAFDGAFIRRAGCAQSQHRESQSDI